MIIDKIRLTNGVRNVDLPLRGEIGSGPFVLRDSEGLGPTQRTARFSKTALDDAPYQGLSRVPRVSTLKIGMHPDWENAQTPNDLRHILYELLSPRFGKLLKMQIMSGTQIVAEARGQITNLDPVMHSDDPEVTMTLEFDSPYFKALTTDSFSPNITKSGGMCYFTAGNHGSAPAGIRLSMLVKTATNTLTIAHNEVDGETLTISGINWQVNDILLLDTREGSRGVFRRTGGGPPLPILNYLDTTPWIKLWPGENNFRVTAADIAWIDPYYFGFQALYEGV